MKKVLFFSFFLIISYLSYTQNDSIKEYKRFYFQNTSIVSSEGYLVDGKPDGYWKSYYYNGILKSEGNRINFLLDGVWKFYNDDGKISMSVTYLNGKKNGERVIYFDKNIIKSYFVDDINNGMSYTYDLDNNLIESVNYTNGVENGLMKEYSQDGRVIRVTNYKNGYIVYSEWINRIDNNGFKQGRWLEFYDNGQILSEVVYLNNKINGYAKYYDMNGSLINIVKYNNGVEADNTENITKLDYRKEYYSNGKIKIEASYKDNVPEGIRREYDSTGKILNSYIFKKGVIVGEGIIDQQLTKHGPWIEYYNNGKKKSEGSYNNGKREGQWKFYDNDGNIEQEGSYDDKGKYSGDWVQYYPTGDILKEETFSDGYEEGMYIEYSEDGSIIVQGNYINGMKNGKWTYTVNGVIESGEYIDDKKNGEWTIKYDDGTLIEDGTFINDNPNGQYKWYYTTGINAGKIYIIGNYHDGLRDGEWLYFDEEGNIDLTIRYNDGEEIDN